MKTVQPRIQAGFVTGAPPEAVPPTEAVARLVVVVPDVAEAALLASRILVMAQAWGQDVLLIGVASRRLSAGELRRRITLLAAFLQNVGTHVQVRVLEGADWISEIQTLLQDDDRLACCVLESQPSGGDPWTEILATRLERPVYVFMDSGTPATPQRGLLARAAPWLGSIAIILGFFWLQALLSQQGDASAYSGWLLLSVPVEIGLIVLCNALLG
jgi:hypothetical protein